MKEQIRLGDCAQITGGAPITSSMACDLTQIPSDTINKYVKILRASNIGENCEIDWSKVKYLKADTARPFATAQINDIVVSTVYPFKVALIDSESSGCQISMTCGIIRNLKTINDKYLLSFLYSNNCKEQLLSFNKSQTIKRITWGRLNDLIIPLPSETVQIEIGEKFFQLLEKNRRMKQELLKEQNDFNCLFDNMN